MPAILDPAEEEAWLSTDANDDIGFLGNLLKPYPHKQMHTYMVSQDVNSPKNNHEQLLQEVK